MTPTPQNLCDGYPPSRGIDNYRPGRLVAEGPLYEVFEVVEHNGTPPGRGLVLKRIRSQVAQDPALRKRLQQALPQLSLLRHPYAEEVIEGRTHSPDSCFLLCERLPGEPLVTILQRDGRLPFATALLLCRQIGAALSAAHAAGLSHGNLTPVHILVKGLGHQESAGVRVKVRDFALGPTLGPDLFGTPAYLAPEQVNPQDCRPAATPGTDQFALATILLEMLSGRCLHSGESLEEVRHKLLRQDPPYFEFSGANQAEIIRINRALQRALQKTPEARFERLMDFVEALEHRAQASVTQPSPGARAQAISGSRVQEIRRQRIHTHQGVQMQTFAAVASDRDVEATVRFKSVEPARPVWQRRGLALLVCVLGLLFFGMILRSAWSGVPWFGSKPSQSTSVPGPGTSPPPAPTAPASPSNDAGADPSADTKKPPVPAPVPELPPTLVPVTATKLVPTVPNRPVRRRVIKKTGLRCGFAPTPTPGVTTALKACLSQIANADLRRYEILFTRSGKDSVYPSIENLDDKEHAAFLHCINKDRARNPAYADIPSDGIHWSCK